MITHGTLFFFDAMLGDRSLRRRSADVSTESSVRGAWASAWLAGSEAALDDVRSGEAIDDPVVQGALRAQAAIGSLADGLENDESFWTLLSAEGRIRSASGVATKGPACARIRIPGLSLSSTDHGRVAGARWCDRASAALYSLAGEDVAGVRASYLTVEELPDRRHRSHPVAPLVWTLALPGGGVRHASSRLATSSRTCARAVWRSTPDISSSS